MREPIHATDREPARLGLKPLLSRLLAGIQTHAMLVAATTMVLISTLYGLSPKA